jgi:hypothetical protein
MPGTRPHWGPRHGSLEDRGRRDSKLARHLRCRRLTVRFLDDPTYKGNGHILMGEDNSDAIAELIIAWLDE